MTEPEEAHPRTPEQEVDVLNRTTKIVLLAMAIVMVCVAVVAVIISLGAKNTQDDARFYIQQNQELQDELQCLRPAALQFDKASGTTQQHIAEALAHISSAEEIPQGLGSQLAEDAHAIEAAIAAREDSVSQCSNDPEP